MQALAKLKNIAHQMKGQDNHADQFPIFAIQREKRIYGADINEVDDVAYYYFDSDAHVEYSFENIEDLKDFLVSEEGEKYSFSDFSEQQCVIVWETTQFFFSRKAAEDYIEAVKNQEDTYRIFVMSAQNHEIKAVLALLNELADAEAEDAHE